MLRLTHGAESTKSAEGLCLIYITNMNYLETSLRMSAHNPGVDINVLPNSSAFCGRSLL